MCGVLWLFCVYLALKKNVLLDLKNIADLIFYLPYLAVSVCVCVCRAYRLGSL